MATVKDFRAWLGEVTRYGHPDDHIEIVAESDGALYEHEKSHETEPRLAERVLRVKLYTDRNCYSITAKEHADGHTYLGCIATGRKPRAGEDWHRGNDLSDGALTRETWHKILADIVSYEMVRIHRNPVRPLPDEAKATVTGHAKATVRAEPMVFPDTAADTFAETSPDAAEEVETEVRESTE